MLDQVQYTDSYQLTQYQACINVLKPLYNRFISSRFRRRRNVNHAKLTDIEVLPYYVSKSQLERDSTISA